MQLAAVSAEAVSIQTIQQRQQQNVVYGRDLYGVCAMHSLRCSHIWRVLNVPLAI